jgi:hypothetical protein
MPRHAVLRRRAGRAFALPYGPDVTTSYNSYQATECFNATYTA